MVPGRRTASTRASSDLLDVDLLDHRLDDPVDIADCVEVAVESARRDQPATSAVKNGSGFSGALVSARRGRSGR